MCSTDSATLELQWWQILPISVQIFPHHSFTATALWITYQRKAASFCALCLCHIILHLKGVEEGGGVSPPLTWVGVFKSHLGSNPRPTKFGRVCWERCDVGPAPCHVEEKLIKYMKEHVELGMRTFAGKPIHPRHWHPTWESRRRYCFPAFGSPQ